MTDIKRIIERWFAKTSVLVVGATSVLTGSWMVRGCRSMKLLLVERTTRELENDTGTNISWQGIAPLTACHLHPWYISSWIRESQMENEAPLVKVDGMSHLTKVNHITHKL